jgi:hypothetical protein
LVHEKCNSDLFKSLCGLFRIFSCDIAILFGPLGFMVVLQRIGSVKGTAGRDLQQPGAKIQG